MNIARKQVFLPTVIAIFVLSFQGAEARTVVCESLENQPGYCTIDTRAGVRLVRQFSEAGCVAGQTWGADGWGIWVTDGCRAQFEVRDFYDPPYEYERGERGRDRYEGEPDEDRPYRPHRQYRHPGDRPRTLRCESLDHRERYCRAPLGYAQVEVQRNLSKIPCRQGENWDWDAGGIWVTKGCRALFVVH